VKLESKGPFPLVPSPTVCSVHKDECESVWDLPKGAIH